MKFNDTRIDELNINKEIYIYVTQCMLYIIF